MTVDLVQKLISKWEKLALDKFTTQQPLQNGCSIHNGNQYIFDWININSSNKTKQAYLKVDNNQLCYVTVM